jgi:hypothetical protein
MKILGICGSPRLEMKGFHHGKPDKPAKQEIVVKLLHQQTGSADGIQDLQHPRRATASPGG